MVAVSQGNSTKTLFISVYISQSSCSDRFCICVFVGREEMGIETRMSTGKRKHGALKKGHS